MEEENKMKKIKINIEIECFQDAFKNWRYSSDDLGVMNDFCSPSLVRRIEKTK